jgi:hypothetical protein
MSLLPLANLGSARSIDPGRGGSLYDHLLQGTTTELPEPVRAMHCARGSTEATGVFRVDRPSRLGGRLLGWVMRLPRATEHVPVTLRIERIHGKETWRRQFGSRTLTSSQWGRDGLLFERFGPVCFALALHADDRTLRVIQRAAYWTLGPWQVRLPASVAPEVRATVSSGPWAMLVDVSVNTRWTGALLHYAGTLVETAEP